MEKITSRRNSYIAALRALASDGAFRRERGEYLADGLKMLNEALASKARVRSVLFKERAEELPGLENAARYIAPAELFDYASPMKNSPGPLFTVSMPEENRASPLASAIVLEGVQDPGNVGAVIRTAAAFNIGAVVLCGECADPWQPKAVRATMGAVFRQRILRLERDELAGFLNGKGLPLYGAALSDRAEDVRRVDLKGAAVAVGSEGRGLSGELLSLCRRQVLIPMDGGGESLNAAVAASILMWEMAK